MISRFSLRNIAVVNFYLYAQDFPLSGRGNTVFLGANGSGKSVLLDAIQIVMTGMNKRYLSLNSRVSEGGRSTRTVHEACLGLLDDGQGYERQACLTYIALGFESEDGSQRCTAGVCLEAKSSLSEESVLGLFVVEDVILRFDDFTYPDKGGFKEKTWQSFQDELRRKQTTIHNFSRQNNRSFLRHLYSIINANARGTQLDPDRARAALQQALSFDIDEIKSVTDFVKRFLLDEGSIEIETFQARYTTWREMQKQIAAVEAEIKDVEVIRSLIERVLDDQFNHRFWKYAEKRAEYDRLGAVVEKQKQELAAMEEQRASTRAYQDRMADELESSRRRLAALEEQISGTPASKQLREAENNKNLQEALRKTANVRAKPMFDTLFAFRNAVLSTTFPGTAFPGIVDYVKTHLVGDTLGQYGVDWPKAPAKLIAALGALPDLAQAVSHVDALHQQATSEKASLGNERTEIERMLNALRGGGTAASNDTQNFQDELQRMGISARTLSEVSDISPSLAQWRGIVEAILGDWVEAVIVEPKDMDRAYSHFNNHYKASRAKLVQTENVSAQDANVRSGTLAEAVETDNRYARAFLNVRLGRIVRARSANDIRRGDLAASEDGKYAHGRGIEYRKLPSMPRLGKSVRNQQIIALTSQQQDLEERLTPVIDRETRLRAIVHTLKQVDTVLVSSRTEAVLAIEEFAAADAESRRQADLIADLETSLPKGILEEKRQTEEMIKRIREEDKEEKNNEHDLLEKIGSRKHALQANRTDRAKIANEARSACPSFERRQSQHRIAIGLERFITRARVAYRKQRDAFDHPAKLRNHFEGLLKSRGTGPRNAENRLLSAIQAYVHAKPDQHPGFEWSVIVEQERPELHDWITIRHRHLTETVLRKFKEQVDKAVVALVETMVHDFLSRLRANIEAVERTKEDLNRALRKTVFMGEVYQVRHERDQDKDTIRYLIDRLDEIAPKATALMQNALDPNDPDQVKIRELIDTLTLENGDDAAHRNRIRELADYRNYFRFAIDICDPTQNYKKISDLDQRRGKASGGQKFVPLYICLGVAAASAYHNHLGAAKAPPPQSALLLMDEAFEKLDPDNIYKIIRFYDELGLQLIMAAPKTHQALYQETFDTLVAIIRSGRAIQARPQHFHTPARELLRDENPMHKPRSYFEEKTHWEQGNAAE